METPDLSFLPRQERKTASMAIAAAALVLAGWVLRGVIYTDAHAAQNDQMAADVATLKVNVARIMDRLNIPKEAELPVRRATP